MELEFLVRKAWPNKTGLHSLDTYGFFSAGLRAPRFAHGSIMRNPENNSRNAQRDRGATG
jgi:hypothetical protein